MEEMMMMQRERLPEFYNHKNFVAHQENHLGSIIANTTNIGTSLYTAGLNNLSYLGSSNSSQEPFSNSPLFLASGGLVQGNFKCGGGHGILPDVAFPASASEKQNSMAAMREMIFRIAAMQPIHIDPESVKPPKRRNVKISKDPQSVAARHRRERISEKIRILQRLVPGGTKMDTASMLDEAIHYVKFLQKQVQSLERSASVDVPMGATGGAIKRIM